MDESAVYKIALSLLPRIGPRLARALVAYTGSAQAVFTEKKAHLAKVPGIGEGILSNIDFKNILNEAEKEIQFIAKNNIIAVFYLDKEYPWRLKECDDSPIIFYYKGSYAFNAAKSVSIVGTRRSTVYGDTLCEKLVADLAALFPDILIVSGFAYGIDIAAHKAAIKSKVPTVAVFGHGLEQVYPSLHRKYIHQVLENGALVSEFTSQKKPDPGNFVSRNRIIAGLSDATIVVESGQKGGALITADMANSYNRDVFAFPGRVGDPASKGCHELIKQNKATLTESAGDIVAALCWDVKNSPAPVQQTLFENLPEDENMLFEAIRKAQHVSIDELSRLIKQPVSKISATLLNMEFKGIVKAMPGKTFKIA
ncbi:MAG: DNA-processing protein DprA [Prolixibacteraceae bacterium]|nr:DNA-processing protein DprA [Prolixibacteraceae bacterium]